MAAPHAKLFGLLCLLLLLASPERALAEGANPNLKIAPGLAVSIDPRLAELDRAIELRARQDRGRRMLAVGIAIAVSGVVHAATFGRKDMCSESSQRMIGPPIAGAIVAGLGFTLALGGGIKLAGLPAGYAAQHRLSPGRRAGLVLGSVGLAMVTTSLLFVTALGEVISCVTS